MKGERGDLRSALAVYIECLSDAPENPAVHKRLASVLEKRGQMQEAASARVKELDLRTSIAEKTSSIDTWFNYSELQSLLGNFAEAKRGFVASLSFENRARTHLKFGEALVLLNEEADAEFESTASVDSLDFDMIVKISGSLTELAQYKKAISYYSQALALRNVNTDTWVSIAYALYKSGNSEDAQAFYEMAKASAAVREMPWADKMHKSAKTEELNRVF